MRTIAEFKAALAAITDESVPTEFAREIVAAWEATDAKRDREDRNESARRSFESQSAFWQGRNRGGRF